MLQKQCNRIKAMAISCEITCNGTSNKWQINLFSSQMLSLSLYLRWRDKSSFARSAMRIFFKHFSLVLRSLLFSFCCCSSYNFDIVVQQRDANSRDTCSNYGCVVVWLCVWSTSPRLDDGAEFIYWEIKLYDEWEIMVWIWNSKTWFICRGELPNMRRCGGKNCVCVPICGQPSSHTREGSVKNWIGSQWAKNNFPSAVAAAKSEVQTHVLVHPAQWKSECSHI